jgi:hypothetical protein
MNNDTNDEETNEFLRKSKRAKIGSVIGTTAAEMLAKVQALRPNLLIHPDCEGILNEEFFSEKQTNEESP